MKSILEKMNELYIKMEEHDGELQSMLQETMKKSQELVSFRIHLEQKENELVSREEAIKHIESVSDLEKLLNEKNAELIKERLEFNTAKDLFETESSNLKMKLEKELAEVEKMRAVFKAKDLAVDKQKKDLEEERKNLKESVIKELIAKN